MMAIEKREKIFDEETRTRQARLGERGRSARMAALTFYREFI